MANNATTFTKITPEDLRNKGVVGLPDAPELTVPALQAKFDEIATDVIVPKFNNLVDELDEYAGEASGDVAEERERAEAAEADLADAITAETERATAAEEGLEQAVEDEELRATTAEGALSAAITTEEYRAKDAEDALSLEIEAEVERAKRVESTKGDMFKGTYDMDNDGVVDDSRRLSGHEASYFANYQDLQDTIADMGDLSDLQTTAKDNLVAAINEAAQTGGGGSSEDSEAWAVGQRNGVDVPPTDVTYHNNSKYYSQQSEASAIDAGTAASDAADIKEEIAGMVGSVTFTVDFTTGEIIYSNDTSYTFTVNQTTGNLEWEVVA